MSQPGGFVQRRDTSTAACVLGCAFMFAGLLMARDLLGRVIFAVGVMGFGGLAAWRIIIRGRRWRSHTGQPQGGESG